jgi:hypothetical protein
MGCLTVAQEAWRAGIDQQVDDLHQALFVMPFP